MTSKLDPKSAPAVPVRADYAEDHVNHRLAKPPKDLLVEVIEVTPTAAKVLLGANTHNRNKSRTHQSRLAGFMIRDVWYPATTVIAFDPDGTMLNGQHTAGGVEESGTTQTLIVAWGVDPDAQAVYDTQSKRTIAQALALEGEDAAAALASVVKVIWQVEHNVGNPVSWVPEPTAVEYTEYITDEMRDSAGVAIEIKKAFGRVPVPVSVLGAAYYYCHEVDADLAETFFEDVRTGGPAALQAAQQLRAHFLSRSARGSQSRKEQVMLWDTIIRAFNKARKGDTTALFSKKTMVPNRWTLPR